MKYYHATFDRRPFIKVGLTPSQVADIYNTVNLWTHSCGPEWTVSRLKDIKLLYVYMISGKPLPESEWIAVDVNGIPKGPFGVIFRISRKKGRRKIRRCLDALLVYTGLVLKTVSKAQRRKFVSSVTAEPTQVIYPKMWDRAIAELRSKAKDTFVRLNYRSFNLSGNKASLDATGKSAPNTCERFVDDFRTTVIWDLLDQDNIADVIADSLDDLWRPLFKVEEDIENNDIGRISVIQEKGCKARFIAIPRLTVQLGLQSLGKTLLEVCRKVPWDCTHDQTAGCKWAQEWLKSGKRLWSVDLSDFTNYWPLELIEDCIRKLQTGAEEGDFELFHAAARSQYRFEKSCIKWTRGQPLGVFPSFPAAALSHGAVVRAIELEVGVKNTFRVLGDDILIGHARVYEMYRAFLSENNIPVSQGKTLEDADCGEFAGAVILHHGHWIPRKVIIPKASNQLLDVARNESKPRDANSIRQFLGSLHGILEGCNPEGLTLQERAQLLSLILQNPNVTEEVLYERKHLVNTIREYYSKIKPEESTVVLSRDWLEYWLGRTLKRCRTLQVFDEVRSCYMRTKALVSANFDSDALDRLERELARRVPSLVVMYRQWYKPTSTSDPYRYYHYMAEYTAQMASAASSDKPWKKAEPVSCKLFMRSVVKDVEKRQLRVVRAGRDLIRQELEELNAKVIELLT